MQKNKQKSVSLVVFVVLVVVFFFHQCCWCCHPHLNPHPNPHLYPHNMCMCILYVWLYLWLLTSAEGHTGRPASKLLDISNSWRAAHYGGGGGQHTHTWTL